MKEAEARIRGAAARSYGTEAASAARRLVAAAGGAGLVDVAYASVDSPLGRLLAAATPRGLVRLAYPTSNADAVLEDLARRLSPRVLEAPRRLDAVRAELDEYFAGSRTSFDIPLDWSLSHGFRRRVLEATAGVEYGQVVTYTRVATEAGSPRAVRAAGSALASNAIPIVVPCHRVVRTGGGLGGYAGGLERKRFLMELEARGARRR